MDKWEQAFDRLPDAILLFDRAWRVERCNKAAEELFTTGAVPVLLGYTCAEILHGRLLPADACPVCRLAGSRGTQQWRGLSSGFSEWFHATAIPTEGGGGVFMARRLHKSLLSPDGDNAAVAVSMLNALESIEVAVHVIDMETHRILWANEMKKRQFGRDIVGGICYEVFQNLDRPCRHCTDSRLIRSGSVQQALSWVQRDKLTGDWMFFVQKAFAWPDGRMAKLEIAADIYDASFPGGTGEEGG